MKFIYINLMFLLILSKAAIAGNKDVKAITSLLAKQVAEWNKGNTDGYMQGYWDNDSLVFIGSKGPRYGYNATLKMYKEAYPDTAHMGKLSTVNSRIQKLSGKYYFVVGRWELKRTVGDLSGSYTLLFRKMKGKWVIICDHSS
jgi:ketosteroid isomerase-like protein